MTHNQENDNKKEKNAQRVTRFYVVFIIIAVVVMIVAAYITYGYQAKTIVMSFDPIIEKIKEKKNKNNSMSIGTDLSRVPSDDVIEDILNDTIPNVCKNISDDDEIKEKCKKKPLSCLKEYKINKTFIQNPGYEDQLYIELITGKHDEYVYTVVIDLANNNQVIHAEGKIDKKSCRDVEEGDSDVDVDDIFLEEGQDPKDSDYVEAEPRE